MRPKDVSPGGLGASKAQSLVPHWLQGGFLLWGPPLGASNNLGETLRGLGCWSLPLVDGLCLGCPWGLGAPHPGSPVVLGPQWWQQPLVEPSPCPSILWHHPGIGCLPKVMVGTVEGPPDHPGLGCVGMCHDGGSQPAPTTPTHPCPPNPPQWARVWSGHKTHPIQSPQFWGGGMIPHPHPTQAASPQGLHPPGHAGGGPGSAPLRAAQRGGRRLPTCLPLAVVFPPELQLCLGFAVIWPGARLGQGRHSLPDAAPLPAGRKGLRVGGCQRVPPMGLGEQGGRF